MGTVGLSFGSPTSGAGFDVSSTVASIVSNLQNVETPWKTQLTSLESQDTAISSLGTLFSNLSNDMSSLTDLEGILAEKTGSSSDTNVLTLTAANSTAVAGTYTVEVGNLAETSSGYLTQIVNANDTLAGSITLQAGTGTQLTLTLNSSDNTLAGLASTINASGAGITANVLSDASGSMLSLVSTTSGAKGNITVSSNSIVDTTALLSYSGTAGTNASGSTSATASTGTLASIANAGDPLSGSISIQVGSGTTENVVLGDAPSSPATNTIYTGTTTNTLSSVASFIASANIGVNASVITNSDGSSSLSLVSQTPGTTGTLTVASNILDTGMALNYTSPVAGKDANLTVDGVNLTSASNTVANIIPGVTFQLLAPSSSGEQVQVVIGNDNTDVESTVNQFVSDYNSLVSAMNTQEGDDSSGNPEPLFGSPTLSLLQQQLLSGLNTSNPNGSLASITDNTGTTLTGSISIQVGGGQVATFNVGSGTNDPATNTYYTGSANGYNTLSGLVDAINAAAAGSQVTYSGTAGSSTVTSSGTMVANSSASLSGSVDIQVGDGTVETVVFGDPPSTGAAADTIYTGSTSSDTTLSGMAAAINNATGLGFTANVVTASGVDTLTLTSGTSGSDGTLTVTPSITAPGTGVTSSIVDTDGASSLSLLSETEGSSGGLTVSSKLVATSDTPVTYSGTAGSDATSTTSATTSTGSLISLAGAGDILSGSMTIRVGNGAAQTVTVPASPGNNLAGLAAAINGTTGIGVQASVTTNSNGTSILSLVSNTSGSAGTLTVTTNLLDTSDTTSSTLNYTNSSDINSLTDLGISVNNDGSITFDATSLDSVLNSDYSSVVGFFQNANGWGMNFSNMLTDAGTSTPTGVLALASTSNSNIESTLNADISKENSLISAQQTSLTAELNSANEIMQELPTQLEGVNELYSAITGYNENAGG